MTPQEIERTLEFILESGAQTAAHIQRLAERDGEMQSMLVVMSELVQIESQRLDRHDETFKALQETQRSMQLLQSDALSRLDQILDRLTRDR
jgi:hypothetical protein